MRENVYEGLKIRREMAVAVEHLRKRLGPSWEPPDTFQLQTLGKSELDLLFVRLGNRLNVVEFTLRSSAGIEQVPTAK